MNLKMRIEKIDNSLNDENKYEYMRDNFDCSLDDFCESNLNTKHNINLLVWILNKYKLDVVMLDRFDKDGNNLFFIEFLKYFDINDFTELYQYEDKFVKKVLKFIFKHNLDLKIEDEQVKEIYEKQPSNKYEDIRVLYENIMNYSNEKRKNQKLTPEIYSINMGLYVEPEEINL